MTDYRALAVQFATKFGLDPNAFVRQINAESRFQTGRRSGAGAQGIAQIMPQTARSWGVNPNDPVAALRAAAQHMAQYQHQTGSLKGALEMYNLGHTAPDAQLPSETRNYIKAVAGGARSNYSAPRLGTASPYPGSVGSDRTQLALSLIGFGNLGGSYGGADPLTTALLQANQQKQPQSYGGTSIPSGSIYSAKNLGRTDMGVDFTGKGAIPVLGDAIVTRAQAQNTGTGWPGQGDAGRGNRGAIVVYKLTSGPNKGKFVYVAENFDPSVKVGQRLRQGQSIGTARGGFPYTEHGWAANAHGTTLASATTGYREGQQTQAGKSFRQFLGNLK